jgi:hypothetical protein
MIENNPRVNDDTHSEQFRYFRKLSEFRKFCQAYPQLCHLINTFITLDQWLQMVKKDEFDSFYIMLDPKKSLGEFQKLHSVAKKTLHYDEKWHRRFFNFEIELRKII